MRELEQQERAFVAHVEDLLRSANVKYRTRYTNFLDLRQISLARQLLAHTELNVIFYGGYQDAERVMMGVFSPDEIPDENAFPIVALTVIFREEDPVEHRDLLGSLLGLGFSREAIGDILVEKGRAICFLTPIAANLAINELKKVGRWGVQLERGILDTLPAKQFESLQLNVSSTRLDCVIAALTKLSREKTQQFIRSRLVCVDGAVAQEPALQIIPGNVLSLRGYGKYIFDVILRTTKKDRLVLQCRKYV